MRSFRMIGQTPHATDTGKAAPPAGGESTLQESPVAEVASKIVPREHGGRDGPEPTRYGDWEKNGRCIDF